MHSIATIAEEIQRIYKRAIGSDENTKYVIDRRELYPIITQVANEMLSISMQAGINNGELTIPPSAVATYQLRNVDQAPDDGRWRTFMFTYPLNLPRNMGIWQVCSQTCTNPGSDTPIYEDGEPMIPIGHDDWDLLRATGLHDSGLFEDQIGYYAEGYFIYFTSAPPETTFGNPISSARFVKIKLLLSNPDLYGEGAVYPIPPDMVSGIVNRVLDILKMNTGTRQSNKQQDR